MTTPDFRNSQSPQYFERSARLSCAVASSPFLLLFLLVAVIQAALLLWLCQLPPWLFWSALLLVLIYALLERGRLRRMTGVLSTRERRWFWRSTGGEEREFQFRGELLLWRWLVVIHGRDQTGVPLRLVLARDALVRDDWRRLQAALRFSR
ncbi:protein YgfX [Microbulbifer echini]|uniref:Protein YgfX n=1 Tax=Microbulbifer echini TaxID=1529067 RepID=A0ABV4NPV9_9GAMM|nr:protein YgfX [uncultured Microbulbifer sp.]